MRMKRMKKSKQMQIQDVEVQGSGGKRAVEAKDQ